MNDEFECGVCHGDLEWVFCPDCDGDGVIDEHEDDPLNYAPGECYRDCLTCEGMGGWLECPNAENHKAMIDGEQVKPDDAVPCVGMGGNDG